MTVPTREIQFSGFRDISGVRQFSFLIIASKESRNTFVVTADLALARKYDIRLQELPLICRRLLDDPAMDQLGVQALTEVHMAAIRAAAKPVTVAKKRVHNGPVSPLVGRAWR